MQNSSLRIVDVSCGLIWRGGQLLATQRQDHQQNGGLWEFPGGKVEPGESREACLHRELAEELAIEVVVQAAWEPVEQVDQARLIRLWPFLCRWRAAEPQLLAHRALRWLSWEERMAVPWAAADRRIAAALTPDLWCV
jgi:8-oxo-dGTP diphosphatase